jgi:hypothetical protein
MIFCVSFEMGGQLFDPLREERNLDLRRSGVSLV